jgi:hypothetical protein
MRTKTDLIVTIFALRTKNAVNPMIKNKKRQSRLLDWEYHLMRGEFTSPERHALCTDHEK